MEIELLPRDCIAHIASYLGREILKLRILSKTFYNFFKSKDFCCELLTEKGVPPELFQNKIDYILLIFFVYNNWELKRTISIIGDWQLEEPPSGVRALGKLEQPPLKCHASTYTPCSMSINWKIPDFLIIPNENFQLYFNFSAASRFDCGGYIHISFGIQEKYKEHLVFAANIGWERYSFPIPNNMEINQINLKAQDNKFWAGHYGPKVADISIYIKPILSSH